MWNRKKKARHPNEKTDKRNTRPDNSDVQATSKRRSPEGGADSVINSISEEISQKSHKADKNMDTTLQESTSTRGKPKSQKASSATSVPQLPMEIVEIIIDNVEDGATFLACSLVCREWLARCRYYFFSRISTSAASCSDLLPILNSSKYAPRPPSPSHSKTRDGGTDRPTLPPAGIFVQSLVITPSSDHILSPSSSSDPRYNPALAAKLLLECIPNVKELQLTSVSGWTIAHFLDPLTRMGKLEGVTLLDVRVSGWNKIMGSLAHCASTLKSLHVSGKIFSAFSSEDGDDNAKVSLPPADLCFPSLKRLSIDMERVYSDYAEDLICILTRGCTEALDHLEVLELPLWIVQSSHEFIQRVGRNLISLTVHCERSQGGNKASTLDLTNLTRLKSLHFSLQSHWSRRPFMLRALAAGLSTLPHSTLTALRITSHGVNGYEAYHDNNNPLKALDDALSLPHLAGLESLELVGMGSSVALVRSGLPKSCARGIAKFLW